ncbi:MAG: glutamine-hydrolyzing GMP synthase [Caulobacteraceae bacterium]
MSAPAHQKVLILDFGSQVTQLIARRLRESGVYCEIWPCDSSEKAITAFRPAAVILSGGPASAGETASPAAPDAVFKAGVPVLGICYGEMTLCAQLGGKVEGGRAREFGRAEIEIVRESLLLSGLGGIGSREPVWMSHGDVITAIPPGFEVIAASPGSPFAAIADEGRRIYGVQFHPEVAHTPRGALILENFTHRIAGLSSDWTMATFRVEATRKIRSDVGEGKVVLGLSGGVDSSVAAVLIHEAIGEALTCVFVDTGLMRLGEAREVVDLFRNHYNIPLIHIDAGKEFLTDLAGVCDPEEKRKRIGARFVDIFEREAEKIGRVDFLAQGTLYPDVIESVSAKGGPSAVIKSHHNVGGLPARMKLRLLEPLRELFKDEVRALGVELGLPAAFVGRHPFPGPGLAIRIPGEVTAEKVAILQKADAIWLEEIRAAGHYAAIWQAFSVLLPVQTVGVMGDARTYEQVLALRAVTSSDGMTADVFEFPPGFLAGAATRIVNEVRGINRVVYDVTSKPPGTIEWE